MQHFVALVVTVLAIFGLLVASEAWWRKRHPQDEFSRKFIHIFVGSLAAFWPFYLSWNLILLLSLAFVGVVAVSKYFRIFKSIHTVERPTWGEVFFALAVGGLAILTHQPWIYAIALLHMSLADGLAAVTGVSFGKSSIYHVFGHQKSVVGTATFFVLSIGLLILYSQVAHPLSVITIVGIAGLASAVENVAGYGLDNLLIPLVVGLVLAQV